MKKITNVHGGNRKVVIITYAEHTNFVDPTFNYNHGMCRCIARLSKESTPFFNSTGQEPFRSNDGCVYLYQRGFKESIENHADEILDFLSG